MDRDTQASLRQRLDRALDENDEAARQRGVVMSQVGQLQLALDALRAGRYDVAEEFVERAIDALRKTEKVS